MKEKPSPAIDDIVILTKTVEVKKESQQLKETWNKLEAVTPRYDFDDLMTFYEINTWHRRCIDLKARLIAGLGWYL